MKKKQTQPMSWQNTVVIIALVLGVFTVLLALLMSPVNIKINCDAKGIEYQNVCPAECWSNNIVCEHCPLPKDLSCDMNVKAPILKLMAVFQ
jgi:hypothetical protein